MNYLARFLMPWYWIAVNGAPIYCLAARLDVTLSPLTGVMHTAVTHSYMFPIASINRACLCTVVTLSCPYVAIASQTRVMHTAVPAREARFAASVN